MTRSRAEIVSRGQEWGLQGSGQTAAGWPLSVLGGVWTEGGIHSHRKENCSQMAWEGLSLQWLHCPALWAEAMGIGDRNSLMWGAPAKVGTYEGLSCALSYKEMLQPLTTHASGTGSWGHNELFLLSYRGRKWRQTGWLRISEHGPNLDLDIPLKALPAGLMQPAVTAGLSGRVGVRTNQVQWTRVRQLLRPRTLPGLSKGTWPGSYNLNWGGVQRWEALRRQSGLGREWKNRLEKYKQGGNKKKPWIVN